MTDVDETPDSGDSEPTVRAQPMTEETAQELLDELRAQHATLAAFANPRWEQKLLDRLGLTIRTAIAVALGLTAFWGLVQVTGATNLAVPVKFFVPADQLAEPSSEFSDDSSSTDSLDDGYCPDGETFSDNFDPDC